MDLWIHAYMHTYVDTCLSFPHSDHLKSWSLLCVYVRSNLLHVFRHICTLLSIAERLRLPCWLDSLSTRLYETPHKPPMHGCLPTTMYVHHQSPTHQCCVSTQTCVLAVNLLYFCTEDNLASISTYVKCLWKVSAFVNCCICHLWVCCILEALVVMRNLMEIIHKFLHECMESMFIQEFKSMLAHVHKWFWKCIHKHCYTNISHNM